MSTTERRAKFNYNSAQLAAGLILITLLVLAPTAKVKTKPKHIELGSLTKLDVIERKLRLLHESANEVTALYEQDVAPLEQELHKRALDPMMARRAAWAIVKEAKARHLNPRLILEILKAENPWLITDTTSSAGAIGWMQVMPFHQSETHPCGNDLTDGPTNVCYGADILRSYLGSAMSSAIRVALLRYNGCVRTPGCEAYADNIMVNLEEES